MLPRGPVCFVGTHRLDAMDHLLDQLSHNTTVVAFADAESVLETNAAAIRSNVDPPRSVITLRGTPTDWTLFNKLMFNGMQYRVDFWVAEHNHHFRAAQRQNFTAVVIAGDIADMNRVWDGYMSLIKLSRSAFKASLRPNGYTVFQRGHFPKYCTFDDDVRR